MKTDRDFKTYEEWESVAETTFTTNFGFMGRNIRDGYNMFGHEIHVETYIPWSCFKSITEYVLDTSILVNEHDPIMDLAREHGAGFVEAPYGDDGMGGPIWKSEDCEDVALRKCFQFIKELRSKPHLTNT